MILKNFRNYVWHNVEGDRNLELKAQLGVGPTSEKFIEVILSKELMRRSYIYIDAHLATSDALNYSIDLPEYLRNIEKIEAKE